MIAAIRNYAGIVAPRRLDLLALPECEEDELDEKQAECDSEPLVQRHGAAPRGQRRRNSLCCVSTKRAFREHGIDAFRVSLDNAQQYLCGRVGAIASLFPVLDRIQFETETNAKFGLREAEALANAPDIDLGSLDGKCLDPER